jgi:hypothetical protein
MGSLSVWHLAIPIVVLALVIAAIVTSARGAPNSGIGPSGFGGWLLLLAVGQTLAPLRTLSVIAQSVDGYRALQDSSIPNATLAIYAEVGLIICFTAFQLFIIVSMYRKRRFFPELFYSQWVAAMGVPIADWILTSALLHIPLDSLVTAKDIAGVLGAGLLGGIWVWYVARSVRVRNTFTN